MTSMNPGPFGPLKRPIYKTALRAVNFVCNAPQARAVSLVGDFNGWSPATHPMRQMPDRAWFLTAELHHGHHRYAFLVDGVLTLDPRAQGITRNDQGERVSLVPVS
jgi:1,4-alpha-glucan branching enzyme